MLYLAAAAYNPKPEVCLNRTLTNVALYKNVNITCDEYGKDDVCSGFTAISHADNAIIVAFRGTSAFIQLMVETSTTILEEQVVSPIGGKVGCYFANVFERLWFNNTMGQDFKTLLNSYPNYDLWLTGHSLGGALASLAAAQIVADGKFDVSKIKLYTFGQPRTGDNDFADAFDAHLPENTTFRITHARDPVPHMPPHSYNYTHNRAEAFYFNNMSPNKTYTLCADEQESKNCSAKIKYVFSVPDHLYYFTINVSNFGKTGCKSNKKQRRK
uniref:Fungal lipase-like domain-containing protein n=1 Tax=Ditylenchus dipsaci TaxID=166011 RepID=A0A915EQ67_9BILA